MDHFILHVTTSGGSIKNVYLFTKRTANETMGSFDVMKKGSTTITYSKDGLKRGPHVL